MVKESRVKELNLQHQMIEDNNKKRGTNNGLYVNKKTGAVYAVANERKYRPNGFKNIEDKGYELWDPKLQKHKH